MMGQPPATLGDHLPRELLSKDMLQKSHSYELGDEQVQKKDKNRNLLSLSTSPSDTPFKTADHLSSSSTSLEFSNIAHPSLSHMPHGVTWSPSTEDLTNFAGPILQQTASPLSLSLTQNHVSLQVAASPRDIPAESDRASRVTSASHSSHTEKHFAGAEVVRDVIIGLSDGLTVPFALAAGLSALDSTRVVVVAGVAEIIAGSISMALGGYLAGRSEIDHYDAEKRREEKEIVEQPEDEENEIVEIFEPYGLDRASLEPLMSKLKADPEKFVAFMMQFELKLERPDPRRSWISAVTIGVSYLLGGLVPLVPYFFIQTAFTALMVSVGLTLFALLVFGGAKTVMLGIGNPYAKAIQTMMIGAVAAAAAFGITTALHQWLGDGSHSVV